MRSRNLALKGHLRPVLELESGSNDPMAYILTIIFTGIVVNQDSSLWNIIPLFLSQLLLGGLLGIVFGKQIVQLGLPKTTAISFIQRDSTYITPTGSTTLMANDKLSALSESQESLLKVFECLHIKTEEEKTF